MKLSIIIPVYNEERTIVSVLEKITELKLVNGTEKEIIVVNDASADKASERIHDYLSIRNSSIIFINNHLNMGKGYCIRKGFEVCTGDYVIMQDADLELNPQDINLLLTKALDNDADVIYGSRFMNRQQADIPLLTKTANRFLTLLTRLAVSEKITDMETCYKLVKTPLAKSLDLKENRFGFEPEITMKLLKKNVKFFEVPVSYIPRKKKEGKKIGWRDGINAVGCILKYRLLK